MCNHEPNLNHLLTCAVATKARCGYPANAAREVNCGIRCRRQLAHDVCISMRCVLRQHLTDAKQIAPRVSAAAPLLRCKWCRCELLAGCDGSEVFSEYVPASSSAQDNADEAIADTRHQHAMWHASMEAGCMDA